MEIKKLISLNGDGNYVRFDRGNDGDMYVIITTTEEKIATYSVRVGVGNSGSQQGIPRYVKKALSDLVDAFQKWENEE